MMLPTTHDVLALKHRKPEDMSYIGNPKLYITTLCEEFLPVLFVVYMLSDFVYTNPIFHLSGLFGAELRTLWV